jgi:hypothetical protein
MSYCNNCMPIIFTLSCILVMPALYSDKWAVTVHNVFLIFLFVAYSYIYLQVDIAAGGWHSTALTEEGEVWMFDLDSLTILYVVLVSSGYFHLFDLDRLTILYIMLVSSIYFHFC